MRRGLDSLVEANPSEQRRSLRSGVIVNDLSIRKLHVLRPCRRNRSRFCAHRGRCQRPLLQTEIVEDKKPQEAEPSGRTRETEEIASRFERQQAVRRVQLWVVVIRHDEQEFLEDRRRVRRIFRQVVEEADPLLVLERGEEGEQAPEILCRQASKETSWTFLGCGYR